MYDPPGPQRRYPSPAAQKRNEDQWRARLGLTFLALLALLVAALIYRFILPA
jgi:hypothetical protein